LRLNCLNDCSPFRAFCPKLRAKLAIVVERFLHGYDEEEVCFALKMCRWEHVRVWKSGAPTSLMGNAASAASALGIDGLGTKAAEEKVQ